MNKLFVTLAAAAALAFAGTPTQEASAQGIHFNAGGLHIDVGNPHRGFGYGHVGHRTAYRSFGHTVGFGSRYPAILGRPHLVGYGHRSHRSRAVWHDTTHVDYVPGHYVPHGNHLDYIPGRHVLHRDGHWDIVGGHRGHRHHH